MLKFYRQFLPQAAASQAPLNNVISGPRVRGFHPIAWMQELHKAFKECKASLSRATLLTHPEPTAQLALVTDASTTAIGAVLQQRLAASHILFQEAQPNVAEIHCVRSRTPSCLRGCEVFTPHTGSSPHYLHGP
jgi:hypothetical protein